jgi:hypothetical protein
MPTPLSLAREGAIQVMIPSRIAVAKGEKWLVSVQGKDGGWGQDGGETSYVRRGETTGVDRQ